MLVEKRQACARLDFVGRELKTRMLDDLQGFPALDDIHPFEREVMRLSLGKMGYHRTLRNARGLIVDTIPRMNHFAKKQIEECQTAEDVEGVVQQSLNEVKALFRVPDSPWKTLCEMNRQLRGIPTVEVSSSESNTFALVGAPNVGKSSLVRAISSGIQRSITIHLQPEAFQWVTSVMRAGFSILLGY